MVMTEWGNLAKTTVKWWKWTSPGVSYGYYIPLLWHEADLLFLWIVWPPCHQISYKWKDTFLETKSFKRKALVWQYQVWNKFTHLDFRDAAEQGSFSYSLSLRWVDLTGVIGDASTKYHWPSVEYKCIPPCFPNAKFALLITSQDLPTDPDHLAFLRFSILLTESMWLRVCEETTYFCSSLF